MHDTAAWCGPPQQAAFKPGVGKKGPVFLELLLVLCPHRGQVGASVPAEPALFICAPRGARGKPPPAPSIQEREGEVAKVIC